MSKRVLYNITSASLQATNISGGTINATTFTGGNLSLSGDLKVAGTLTTVNITSTNLVNTNVSAGVVVASTLLSATGNSNTIGNIFTTSGNVGIGTASPNNKLHVVGSTSNLGGTIAEFRNPGNAESLQIIDETSSTSLPGGILNATGSYGIGVYARNGPVRFFTTAGNLERMRITETGNVGIGTTSPGSILHVAGVAGSMPTIPSGNGVHMGIDINSNSGIQLNSGTNGSVNYEYIDFGYSGIETLARIIHNNSNRSLLFQVNSGTNAMQLNSTGNVSITNLTSTNIVATNLSAGSLGFSNISVTSATIGTSLLAIGNSNTVGAIITTGGNVGIGTTSPAYTLDVSGTIRASTSLTTAYVSPNLLVNNATGNGSTVLALMTPNLTTGGNMSMFFGQTSGNGNTGQLNFGYHGNNNTQNNMSLTFFGGGGAQMYLVNNGNIGIGTTSPSELLTVNGNIRLGPSSDSNADYSIKSSGQLTIAANDASTQDAAFTSLSLVSGVSTNQSAITVVGSSTLKYTSFATSNTERMRIDSSGNVGIGTSSPSFKLDVAGNGRFTGPGGVGTNGSVLITGQDNYSHTLYVASAASQKRIGLSHNGTVGNIFAFDYGGGVAQNLCLQFAGGSVGIGTTSPIRPLHVQGAARLGGSGPALDFGDDYTTQIYRNGTTSEMRFNTNSLERMTISSTGNVGIGTLSPESSLHVVGSGGPSGVQLGAEGGLGFAFIQLNGGTVGSAGAFIDFGYSNLDYISRIIHNNSNRSLSFMVNGSGTSSMTIASTGNIGIGTASPLAKLHISGQDGTISSAGRAYFRFNDGTTVNYNTGGWGPMSIYATGDIVSGSYFASHGGTVQTSDSRIKHNIQDINTNIALGMLRQFKPKTYKFKDNIKNEDKIIYGFVAQEIKTIVPDAIRMTKKEVPNIFELADVLDGNKIILTKNSTSILKVDDEIMLYDSKNNEIKVVITNIIDDYTFIIDKQLNSEQINSENIDNKIFVYGQIVDDFHYLNKDHLFTITTSALQEIDQQLQSTKDIISNQKTEINDLKSDINYLKQTINDLMLRNNLI